MTPTSTAPVDLLSLTGVAGAGSTSVTVASELMRNQQLASPIDPVNNIVAALDSLGQPLLFSIGNDGVFNVIVQDTGGSGGFTAINLLTGLSNYGDPVAFGAAQDASGNLTIGVALPRANGTATDVLLAGGVPNTLSQTDWSSFSSRLTKVSGIDPGFAAQSMLIGTSDDNTPGIAVVIGILNSNECYYLVQSNNATLLQFPENVNTDSLLQMSLGFVFGQKGVFFLYQTGAGQTLECTTLATAKEDSETYDYSPGNDQLPAAVQNLHYNCIATPLINSTAAMSVSSDIYVGCTTGIYVFSKAHGASLSKVTDAIQDVHQLYVCGDSKNVSIWAVASPGCLYYISGTKGPAFTWNDPVLFRSSVLHVAPLRGKANELFLVEADSTVSHVWQDPTTTMWNERSCSPAPGSKIVDFVSYTTHVHVADANGRALPGQSVNVTASEWTYATVNGEVFSLDSDTPASATTDVMGNLTIINMTKDLSSPAFALQIPELFSETVTIFPNGKVVLLLQNINTGTDLSNATKQDGSPLLTTTYSPDLLNSTAQGLQQLSSLGSKDADDDNSGRVFVSLDGVPKPAAPPTSFSLGLKYTQGNWIPQPAASLLPDGLDINSLPRTSSGDVYAFLDALSAATPPMVKAGLTLLKEGVKVVFTVVGGAVQLVIDLLEQVLMVALDSLRDVLRAIDWLLEQVGVDLDGAIDWLGHESGLDEIVTLSDSFVTLANQFFTESVQGVSLITSYMDGWFAEIEKNIATPAILDKLGAIGSQTISATSTGATSAEPATPSTFQVPTFNWPFYQLLHGGPAGDTPDTGPSFDQDILDQIEAVLGKFVDGEGVLADKTVSALIETLLDGLDTMTIQEVLVQVIQILAVASLEALRQVVDAILGLVSILFQALQTFLNTPVDIPILTDIFVPFLGDRDFTLLRAFALVVAMLTKIVSQILSLPLTTAGLTFPDGIGVVPLIQSAIGTSSGSVSPAGHTMAATAGTKNVISTLFNTSGDDSGDTSEPPNPATAAIPHFTEFLAAYVAVYEAGVFVATVDLFFIQVENMTYAAGGWIDKYVQKKPRPGIIPVCKLLSSAGVFSFHAINLNAVNKYIKGSTPTNEEGSASLSLDSITWYEYASVGALGLRTIFTGIGFLNKAWKPYTRYCNAGIYVVATGLLVGKFIYDKSSDDETSQPRESEDLLFVSNLADCLFRLVSSYPFQITPERLALLLGVNGALGFLRAPLVLWRFFDDTERKVAFRFV